ncbi:Uncharacterized protein FWK35_00034430, partial [Aphis craccivora]
MLHLIDGCPNQDSFFATSAKDILNFFDVGIKANYAYAVMANHWITVKSKNANYKIPDNERNNSDNDIDDQGDDDIQNEHINECT